MFPAHLEWFARRASWVIWLAPAYLAYLQLRMYQLRRQWLKQEELFRLISENAADMIALVDVKGRRLYNSPAYKKVLGYSPRELSATSSFEQIHPDDRQKVMAAAADARRTGVGKRLEYRVRHKNGTWLVLESSASAIRNQKGEVEKLVIVNRDITERKRTEEKLEHTALHDALTDLPNRGLFLDQLRRGFERARKNPGYKFAVLFVDIDGFKVFNDTLGHGVGDELIIEMSRRLAKCLRIEDTICRPIDEAGCLEQGSGILARLGGDEFTIFIGSVHDPSDAMRVAKRIQEALAPPFAVAGREVFLSASIGIALSTTAHNGAEELLRDADIAMYRAKTLGKSRCEFFDPEMHTRAVKRLNLETDLRRAVEEEEFRLHYQPIVLLKTGRITGFEALLRWQHSEEGLKYPDTFIGVAEGTGLVIPLGKWVLQQACRQAQIWQSHDPRNPALSVTVNVSPKQFAYSDLVRDLGGVLEQTGIDPGRLQLEITESLAMADLERSNRVFSELKQLGVLISIDDFGTGYSSLARLRRFPVDILKIDRSFVAQMDADAGTLAIVRLIIEFAHTMNLKVVAEGVEKATQVDHLRALGCELAQGYLFSRPVDPENVGRLLAANVQEGNRQSGSDGANKRAKSARAD